MKQLPLQILWLLGFALPTLYGQVVINEFAAATSDRLLQRAPGAHPRVGTTTPWQMAAFDDSRWSSGPGPFGFGKFSGVTVATDLSAQMQNRAASLYLRKAFTVSAAQAASGATLQLVTRYNDGFIAFLNGVEVARRNMGNPRMFAYHDQTAFNTNSSNPSLSNVVLGACSALLVPGDNILCIQAHNQALAGSTAANFLLQADLQVLGGATLVSNTASWKFLPGLAEPSGGVLDYGLFNGFLIDSAAVAWASRPFNDATWLVGCGPVGIEGTSPPAYVLGVNLFADMFGVTPSLYTRRVFTISPTEAASESALRLTIDYDDGVVVYLNGKEVARRNVGTSGVPTAHDVLAKTNHSANVGAATGREEILLLGPPKTLLVSGDNVLAVQLHRASLTSSNAVARVTLETTESGARGLCQPSDEVSYFVGLQEPVVDDEGDDVGPLEEAPDAENDWIELYNAGSTIANLTGWSLTDDAAAPRKWMFPTNTTIPAGGYLVVLATGLDTGPAQGATYLHANFKLGAEGEYLGLVDADNAVVSELAPTYPSQSYLHSYGRDTNGVWGHLAAATPGAANVGTALALAPAAPAFSVAGGFYTGALSLVLTTVTPGATIEYTLNGSEPNPGTAYTGAIAITSNTIVRARAVQAGCRPSATRSHTYLINQSAARRSLPALCLGGDPVLTYYGPNTLGGPTNGEGIFAIQGGGYVTNIWTASNNPAAFHYPLLSGKASEKPATLEYFPLSGAALRTDFGLRISGSAYSRPRYRLTNGMAARFTPTSAYDKPSFNLFFRSELGVEPLDYPLFDNSPVTRFENVRVRAGKNDISNPFIKDELLRRIYLGTGQQSALGTFNTVYINGVFKGFYNLCEHLREGFMQEHHHSSEPWDVTQVNVFASGDPLNWNKMFAYLRSTNLTYNAAYVQVQDYLDVDNFIDYLVVNAYAAMWDWPNNNWVAARERTAQGRWRFYMWDAEGAFGASSRTTTYNTFTNDLVINDARTTTSRFIPALYTLLRASPEFRLRFADRAQKHLLNGGCLVKTNLQSIYLGLRDRINPIMQETIGATVNESFYNTWIVSDARRTNFLAQLVQQGLWPATLAPLFSHYGGNVSTGLVVTLTNPNLDGAIYFSTNGIDPRAPGGVIVGSAYVSPVTINQSTRILARVCSLAGIWSPVIDAQFTIPPPAPTFLPGGSGDWTTSANWSSSPAPFPNGPSSTAIIPPPAGAERNVNLYQPVTIGQLTFPQNASTVRNRIRDRNTTNTLTFHSTNGPARIEVGGNTNGYVEFEVAAGTILRSDLQLHITNPVGDDENGALRLRESWSGPGGLIKTGTGIASLTGAAKTYTGETLIQQGVLSVTQPATPTASSLITVQSGGQLRLVSANDTAGARVYHFGGPLRLAGFGRGSDIPEHEELGKLGALRFDPGSQDNQAVVVNPIMLTEPTDLHVDGSRNSLELGGLISGLQPITKSGGGTLRLTADNSEFVEPVQVDNGALALVGRLGSPVTLADTGTLTGHGEVGALCGSGTVLLDRTSLHAAGATGLHYQFVLGQTGSPLYRQSATAGNGVLVLPSVPVAVAAADFYLAAPAPTPSSVWRGGFLAPFDSPLAPSLSGAMTRVFVPDALGTQTFSGQNWSPLASAQITTVAETADFGAGPVPGRVVEIRVGGAPATFAAWQAAAFPNPADRANPLLSGPGADPLGTGMANLMRYALDLTLAADPATRVPRFAGSAAAPAIQFPFDAGRNDIVYLVEASFAVDQWSSPATLFDSRSNFPPVSVNGWITISDSAPSANQRYYRLRVALQTSL